MAETHNTVGAALNDSPPIIAACHWTAKELEEALGQVGIVPRFVFSGL